MQLDLFGTQSQTLIEVVSPELPNVLSQYTQGIQLGSHFVPYQLRRSKRRSVGFMITDQGLRVTAPRWLNLTDIKLAIVQQQRWILRKLQERAQQVSVQPIDWTNGAEFPFLGRTVTLSTITNDAENNNTRFDNTINQIKLVLPPNSPQSHIKQHLQTWLMNQAKLLFHQRLTHYAQQLSVQYHSFALSNAKTQWGSCSVQRKIRLNWRLVHLPVHLIDYVIAHELAHLFEMNHSPRFWAIVAQVFPGYVAARSELKRIAISTLPQF